MLSRILAFRPARVVARLPPRSGACPLSGRELLGPASELGLVLPVVRAPVAGVARAALVAAKQLGAAVGLALPAGAHAARWFDAVAAAADEVASGLPILLAGEVAIEGEGGTQVERAAGAAWRLADAGLTHLAFDVADVAPPERGRVLAEVAAAAAERGISVEAVLPFGEGPQSGPRAAAMLEGASRAGVAVDLASVRCPAPADDDEARLQVAALARMCGVLAGVPVMRRGPVTPGVLDLLRGSPVKACEDGGAAGQRALAAVALDPERPDEAPPDRMERLERAAAELRQDGADRLEASAYAEAIDFMERLGVRGSAIALARALERRLEDR